MSTTQDSIEATSAPEAPKLRRALNLPLLVLYGLGTTIGAGIYVLVGATAGRAGLYAPLAFIVAALAVAPTAAAYSELAGRHPVSANFRNGSSSAGRAARGQRPLYHRFQTIEVAKAIRRERRWQSC